MMYFLDMKNGDLTKKVRNKNYWSALKEFVETIWRCKSITEGEKIYVKMLVKR